MPSMASVALKTPAPIGRGSVARGWRVADIYQNILDAVVEHRLPPGVKLTEEQLGAVFAASRTIVRSALQALAHDHIVTLAPRRGAFVSAPTIEDAHDIFAGRKLVESAIAREVARQISPAQLGALRALLGEEHAALSRGDRPAAIRLSGAATPRRAATMSTSPSSMRCAPATAIAQLMGEHLDHILGDLDLSPREEGPVDIALVLRGRLAAKGAPARGDVHRFPP